MIYGRTHNVYESYENIKCVRCGYVFNVDIKRELDVAKCPMCEKIYLVRRKNGSNYACKA